VTIRSFGLADHWGTQAIFVNQEAKTRPAWLPLAIRREPKSQPPWPAATSSLQIHGSLGSTTWRSTT